MSWTKHLVGSRSFQKTVGVVAAEYLRLVWKTTRFVTEPEGIYERFDREAPVIIAMWHGQHFLARSGSASAPFGGPATTAVDSSARLA
jgi:lysophospholipid acyltransferase (LPLAT)-like uncharacterized protein